MRKSSKFKPVKSRDVPTKHQKRCWQVSVGAKNRVICNDDSISKRKFVRNDIYNHLSGCVEASVDGKTTSYINPINLQYSMQSGIVKSIKCRRRNIGERCWNAKIIRDNKNKLEVPICENDPAGKTVDVLDAVDSLLAGCSKARFWHGNRQNKKDMKDTFTMRRVGGLNTVDRRVAGGFIINGDAREVRCIQRSKGRD